MPSNWPALSYPQWRETCDTLHAHTQVLGKLAVGARAARAAAPARRAAPDRARLGDRAAAGAGRLGGARRRARPAHPRGGRRAQRRWRPARRARPPTGRSARSRASCWTRSARSPAPSRSTRRRRRSPWSVPLDEDDEHARYDPAAGRRLLRRRDAAALVLAAFRAPYRGRSTPVNAWWGSFDLAVNLFSGEPADPPSDDFIMRNAMDAQEVAVGWWPGDPRYRRGGVLRLRAPGAGGVRGRDARPRRPRAGTRRSASTSSTGTTCARAADPHAAALEFARSAFDHACAVCEWDPALAASAEGSPPPVA